VTNQLHQKRNINWSKLSDLVIQLTLSQTMC